MSGYRMKVLRADGRVIETAIGDDDLKAACRRVLETARQLATHGCPYGDTDPPRAVELCDGAGAMLLRIAVRPELRADPAL